MPNRVPGSCRGVAIACILLLTASALPADPVSRISPPAVGAPGTSVIVPHTVDNQAGVAFTAYTLSVCFPSAALSPTGVSEGADLLAATGGSVFFFDADLSADGVGVQVILSGVGASTIPTGIGLEMTVLTFENLSVSAGILAPVDFCDFTSPNPPMLEHTNFLIEGSIPTVPDLVVGPIPDPTIPFVRGDGNGDGNLNIADTVFGLAYLFSGGPGGACLDTLDANDDGAIDISDPVWIAAFLFSGGPPPSAPFPLCGGDPTPGGLDCASPGGGC